MDTINNENLYTVSGYVGQDQSKYKILAENNYVLKEEICHGPFSQVYKACKNGAEFAIKIERKYSEKNES